MTSDPLASVDAKDVLLFGAGASKDAGLPDTFELTDRVLDLVSPGPEATILAFVVGGLLFSEGARGVNPRAKGIDIETVARAIERLARRRDSDIAPFVGAWHPRLDDLDLLQPSRSAAAAPGYSPYEATMVKVLVQLWRILWLDAGDRTAYLTPLRSILARQRRLVIATLNYDNVVEQFCVCAGSTIPYSIGFREMNSFNPRTGYKPETIDDGILLLKLHGSLNWSMHDPPVGSAWAGIVAGPFVLMRGTGDLDFEKMLSTKPAVLFGGENKLTAEGPFMQLLARFRDELRDATRLTIVGYSFRDQHVNAQIASFANESERSEIVVIDPAPLTETGFLHRLQVGLGSRLSIVREKAAVGLAQVLA